MFRKNIININNTIRIGLIPCEVVVDVDVLLLR